MCAEVCLARRIQTPPLPPPAGFVKGRLPPRPLFPIRDVAQRRPAIRLFPSTSTPRSCSCSLLLPWVCKQICAHVTSRFASQLSFPSALPRNLSPPICRQKEGRMSLTLTNRAPASMLMCVCLCAHAPVHLYVRGRKREGEREGKETFAAKRREAPSSSMRMADVLTTKTRPFLCQVEVSKSRDDAAAFIIPSLHTYRDSSLLCFDLSLNIMSLLGKRRRKAETEEGK